MAKRKIKGKIVSLKMPKTLVVNVERIKRHPKYKKRFKTHKKYKVHYEKGQFEVGQEVVAEECRPISKDKRWKVLKKID